jgi:hypothetical protein
MRPVRRPFRPQRRRVFLGCEGESEQGYGALLRRLLEARRQDVHLDVVLLRPGGGDPLALVELAQRRVVDGERKHASYAIRGVLLDADTLGRNPERDAQMRQIARAGNFRLIWQRPCHEALLLRHLENCANLRPLTTGEAKLQLVRRWPDYVKGVPAMRLALRIGERDVRQVLQVEPDLAAFLVKSASDKALFSIGPS